MRRGEAGPAVLGFLRPRIVTPDGFQTHFTPQEQAAILTHERVHLARQDARINALAALLRCLCWFNPLIHLGARWLRIDQELACDATCGGRSDLAPRLCRGAAEIAAGGHGLAAGLQLAGIAASAGRTHRLAQAQAARRRCAVSQA